MKNNAPTLLIILDGFGYSQEFEHNAIAHAHMPYFSSFLSTYPSTTLQASGQAVGLPEGCGGNSEVGHITIGCGAIIKQPFTIVEDTIKSGDFFNLEPLKVAFNQLKNTGKTLHLMGIASDAGVHGSLHHLFALMKLAKNMALSDVILHLFLDGRDCAPHAGYHYLEQVEAKIKELGIGKIATIHGRYYAMDRNKNWNITLQSYRTLTECHELVFDNWKDLLQASYAKDISDEFIVPTQLLENACIKADDGIVFYNCRPDRMRQLTACFTQGHVQETGIVPNNYAFFITPFSLGDGYETTTLFVRQPIRQTLTSYIDQKGYTIFSIAETEKYAHVTYFFNGGREEKLPHETRILVPSITRKDYALFPGMSAAAITQAVLDSLRHNMHDFYVINYANADMVGHTGNFNATVQALEILDMQLGQLVNEVVHKLNGTVCITSDHGKAECMVLQKGDEPYTAHTANPVYFIVANQKLEHVATDLPLTQLSDIAPFLMHIIEDGI